MVLYVKHAWVCGGPHNFRGCDMVSSVKHVLVCGDPCNFRGYDVGVLITSEDVM